MKRLLGLLLVIGMVGCGEPALEEILAAPEELGAKIRRNSEGQVVGVQLQVNKKITDARPVYLKALTCLRELNLTRTEITELMDV